MGNLIVSKSVYHTSQGGRVGNHFFTGGTSWQWGELSWYRSEWATNQNGKCTPDEICIHPVFAVILYYCFANNLARIRKDGYAGGTRIEWELARILSKQDFDPDHCTSTWPMVLNFPVFATVERIFRASNDVGPLFLGPGSTRILEINTR